MREYSTGPIASLPSEDKDIAPPRVWIMPRCLRFLVGHALCWNYWNYSTHSLLLYWSGTLVILSWLCEKSFRVLLRVPTYPLCGGCRVVKVHNKIRMTVVKVHNKINWSNHRMKCDWTFWDLPQAFFEKCYPTSIFGLKRIKKKWGESLNVPSIVLNGNLSFNA